MKLTKLLLEYPGAFTPRPEDEREKNRKDMELRRDPNLKIQRYIENGSVGDLNLGLLSDINADLVFSLPDNLTVNGNLALDSCSFLRHLPKNLTVKGTLDISFTKVTRIPHDISVDGSIYAEYSGLVEIPDNFTVYGSLNVNDCANMTKLPKNLKIHSNLFIQSTAITDLPISLHVIGDLYCSHSYLTKKYSQLEILYRFEDRGGFIGGAVYT